MRRLLGHHLFRCLSVSKVGELPSIYVSSWRFLLFCLLKVGFRSIHCFENMSAKVRWTVHIRFGWSVCVTSLRIFFDTRVVLARFWLMNLTESHWWRISSNICVVPVILPLMPRWIGWNGIRPSLPTKSVITHTPQRFFLLRSFSSVALLYSFDLY